MRRAINSRFPQYQLLRADRFLELLKDYDIKFNGIDFSLEHLEYYDQREIIRPILRINRRLGDTSINQISSPKLLDNYFISEYLEQGIAQFAVEGDYQDWSNYREGSKKRTRLYYHPTQFMAFQALALQSTVFSPSDIENIQNPTSFAEILQQSLANEVQASRNAYRQTWIRRIGLLILLEEAYSPLVREFRDRPPSHNGSLFNEWKGWRVKEFSTHDLLASSGMTIEEVREF